MIKAVTQFTKQQERAIETRDVSVALSAGAGCGKTFVLTERFLSYLEPADAAVPLFAAVQPLHGQPAKLHELVAITFTDRAAREMRDRIRKKCYERLKSAPAEQVDHWLRLLRSLDTARVSTIHAFCGALLRSHAVEAQLDPRFVVIEQSQADTVLAEIIEDVLREKLSGQDAAVLELTTSCGLERLRSMIGRLTGAGRTIDFEAWLARTPEEVTQIWDRYRRDVVVPQLLNELSESPAARELLELICELGGTSGELEKRCVVLSEVLPNLPQSKTPAVALDAIAENARVQGAGSKKTWPSEELYERFKVAAEKLRGAAKDARQFLDFDASTALADALAGLQLLALAKDVLQRYEGRKRESAWLDFNDLLVRARDLLTDPAHAELQQRLSSQLRLLLVDECQDTDPVQVELIKALCGERYQDGKLFFVGDFKQSIYRFRGADPHVFRQLQESTPGPGRLPLTANFRSQPAILEFVNALFCDALSNNRAWPASKGTAAPAVVSEPPESKPLGAPFGRPQPPAAEDESLKYEPLVATRPQTAPRPAIEFLWAVVDDMKKSAAGARDKARRKEADYIARRIRNLLDGKEKLIAVQQPNGKWDKRSVEQRDIALLFRTLSDVQHCEEALRRQGIDYYLVGGHAFYAQQEIYDVVNLLRTLASPADEINLVGVLRSPMFALTDETLFWLGEHPQGLAAGLFAEPMAGQLMGEDRRRAMFAAATLQHLRSRKDRRSITALLNEALSLTGYDAVLLAEFLGERKLANLRKLQDQARIFDQSGSLGLADFIVQLSEFVVNQPREPLAATHPEGTDVVRLMTIHQAKGLEFPVVFVPDIGRYTHGEDRGAVWDETLGPLMKLPARAGSEQGITGLDLHNVVSSAQDSAERIRLLYVATTRAADYLVLSAGTFHEELETPTAPWLKLLSERFDLQTGECRAKLPEDYTPPMVKVTSEAPATTSAHQQSQQGQDLDKAINQVLKLAPNQTLGGAGDLYERLAEPLTANQSARRRFSVSRLSGELQSQTAAGAFIPMPADDDEQLSSPGSAADLGTLVHQALARIKFDGSSDAGALVRQCAEAAGGEAMQLVPSAEKLAGDFLQSDRAGELAKAPVIHRELEFLLPWPPRGRESVSTTDVRNSKASSSKPTPDPLKPPLESANHLYLQGFIDCLYQDAQGKWHLLDYKTNRVPADGVKQAAESYAVQLGVYALAVEQILGNAPVELSVHFLRAGAEHRFEWDEAMRQRTIEEVGDAIRTAQNC